MIPRLRTVALLMLVAGLALGVFLSRAVEAVDAPDRVLAAAGEPRIESAVALYQRHFQLDDPQAELVRQELVRYDGMLRALLYRLRQDHDRDFQRLFQEADERIRRVLEESGR